jgi:hypothetical protein
MLNNIARVVDLLALSLVLGTTVWFFFVQAPVLIKRMGSERFVPLQMRMTILFFNFLIVVVPVLLAASIARGGSLLATPVVGSAVALVAVLINTYAVVPRALKAGGHSRTEVHDEQASKSVARFASEGAGKPAKVWHRLVVVFVVVMLGGLLPHAFELVRL